MARSGFGRVLGYFGALGLLVGGLLGGLIGVVWGVALLNGYHALSAVAQGLLLAVLAVLSGGFTYYADRPGKESGIVGGILLVVLGILGVNFGGGAAFLLAFLGAILVLLAGLVFLLESLTGRR